DMSEERQARCPKLGQQERHLRLHPGKTAIYGPDVIAQFLSWSMWGMVGGDHVDRAVTQALPQTNLMPPFPNRRVHTDDRAMVGVGALLEQEVMRAGLPGDIDAPGPCRPHWTHLLCPANV